MICSDLTSKIQLTIESSGYQNILNELFYTEPTNVYINSVLDVNCKKYCNLTSSLNYIIIEFDYEINSCENMFSYTNIKEIDLSLFDSSKVTSMKSMFEHCTNLININFGEIDTSSVTDMSKLFYYCQNLNPINVSSFNTSSVKNMNSMFSYCESLTSIDASNFNTLNVETMNDLFSYDRQLISVDISSFNTPKVREMQGIFYCCEKIKFLDLQNFDGSLVTNFQYVFGYLYFVDYINLRKFKISEDNNVATHEAFININRNAKYCIEDSYTKNYLIGNINSECPELCFQKNIKVDTIQATCECNEYYKNEFLVKCYDECPGNNQTIKDDKYTCEGPVPENYYLDIDEMYKKCFNTCKICNQSGNETNNNCIECINDYKFLNDSLAVQQNCYKDCEFYYYFNELNEYKCTQNSTCPTNYKNLISQKRKCIDDCKKDDNNEYIYEYNNICLKECPENKKIYEEEKICLDECYPFQFEYNNTCYNDCPSDKYRLFRYRNICSDSIPDNYYLDNNNNIYKECYTTCKNCIQEGNSIS